LDQKVRGQVRVLSDCPHADVAPPAERHNLTRSVAVTERGKPVATPFGAGESRDDLSGLRAQDGGASERRSVIERIGVEPPGDITPRRKPADFPVVFRHERVVANRRKGVSQKCQRGHSRLVRLPKVWLVTTRFAGSRCVS